MVTNNWFLSLSLSLSLLLLWLTTLLSLIPTTAFVAPIVVCCSQQRHASSLLPSLMPLQGWLPFLRNRQNDFIPLDKSDDTFGPGPALILHQIPPGIDDDEIQDMIADGAPLAWKKGVAIARVQEEWLPWTVQQAVQHVVVNHSSRQSQQVGATALSTTTTTTTSTTSTISTISSTFTSTADPVLYFSGFRNSEMMAVYGILGKEIYNESGATAACAKVVPNAMTKSLQQVLDEISGDHMDATTMNSKNNNDDSDNVVDRTS